MSKGNDYPINRGAVGILVGRPSVPEIRKVKGSDFACFGKKKGKK